MGAVTYDAPSGGDYPTQVVAVAGAGVYDPGPDPIYSTRFVYRYPGEDTPENPALDATARAFGEAGRRRVIERFTWSSVAERTVSLYRRVTGEVDA